MATFYQDAAGNWKISGPYKKYTDEEFGKLVESEPLESRLNRYQRLNQYWNEYKGLGLNVGDAPTLAEFGLDSTATNLPSATTAPGTTPEATTSAYTTPTDYSAPASTPTANAPTLPTGTNAAAATTAITPTYGGTTTYGKKSKSPFAASGTWPVTNKKYPYKSSLFKTQTSELL